MDWHSSRGRIALLSGGSSAERDVSLASGLCVATALKAAGYTVEIFDPAALELASIAWGEFNACFIALHGGAGEDGRLQRRLDLLKVPYTGSGPAACRLAMSKSASKERFLQAGVPTLPYVLFPTTEPAIRVANRVMGLGYPLIIKPDSQGSSLGVSVAHEAGEIDACLAACRPLDAYAIAEPLVRGRELTIAVLRRRALPIIEIIAPGGIFDYAAKYNSDETKYRFDIGLPADTAASLERTAIAAADCLGIEGLCRVDLMLDQAGHPWVLEVNAVPGMTEHSLAPMAARQAGLPMPQLCDLLIQQCLPAEVIS